MLRYTTDKLIQEANVNMFSGACTQLDMCHIPKLGSVDFFHAWIQRPSPYMMPIKFRYKNIEYSRIVEHGKG
jgi:hypothetical protein